MTIILHEVALDAELTVAIRVLIESDANDKDIAEAAREFLTERLMELGLGTIAPLADRTKGVVEVRITEATLNGDPTIFEYDGIEMDDGDQFCKTCGTAYRDGGDGENGECPDCADKTYLKENPDG